MSFTVYLKSGDSDIEDDCIAFIVPIRMQNYKNGTELIESNAATRHYSIGWGGIDYDEFADEIFSLGKEIRDSFSCNEFKRLKN